MLVGDDLSSAALAAVTAGSTKVDVVAALSWPHVSVEHLSISIFLFRQLPDGTYLDSVLLTGLEEAKYVAVVDLDGDGLLDLVTATSDDASVSWYRQIPPELPPSPSSSPPYGNFTFGEKRVIFDGRPEVVVAVTADTDGDGDVDKVATSEELSVTYMYLFENDGEANFLNHFGL